jgi:hypothetical protein
MRKSKPKKPQTPMTLCIDQQAHEFFEVGSGHVFTAGIGHPMKALPVRLACRKCAKVVTFS